MTSNLAVILLDTVKHTHIQYFWFGCLDSPLHALGSLLANKVFQNMYLGMEIKSSMYQPDSGTPVGQFPMHLYGVSGSGMLDSISCSQHPGFLIQEAEFQIYDSESQILDLGGSKILDSAFRIQDFGLH